MRKLHTGRSLGQVHASIASRCLHFFKMTAWCGPMIHFRLFGIPIEIQPFFWLIMVMLGSGFGRGVDTANQALNIALFVIAGAISVLVHELGHALMGRKFGARPHIVLHSFGGYAAFPDGRFTRLESFMVTAAGPLLQLALGGISFGCLMINYEYTESFQHFLFCLTLVSIFWALINCIPVIPLDGGQMLHAAMGMQRRKLTLQISIAAAIIGATVMIKTGSLIFPLILAYYAWQNYQELREYR